MDKYIVVEIYSIDKCLQVVNIPVTSKGVKSTINSIVKSIHDSFDNKETHFISFVGTYESITVRKKDIVKILINGGCAINGII